MVKNVITTIEELKEILTPEELEEWFNDNIWLLS